MRGVSRAFAERRVLDGVDLVCPAGVVTALIGASGCGKSTLLKLCNGLVTPDSGEVRVFGEALDYRRLGAVRRRMGYAVQGTALFPHLTARDNICLAARVAGWDAAGIQARLEELVTLMHLDAALLDRFPHQLSGGQQQRVGLSRAMMLRPEVLLLDEPFAAIDPITRHDIHGQLLEVLEAEPVTVLLVTHDMREAMRLASHIVVMQDGRISCDSSVAALREAGPELDAEALLQALLFEERA